MLKNSFSAKVYIPTRTVTNVINYPRGYIRCLVDINLDDIDVLQTFKERELKTIVQSFTEQFPSILRAEPEIEAIKTLGPNEHFLKTKAKVA